ncbi:hypothetical protein ACFCYN_04540 [Gottfriedia sp. NPDC056225]|uniref:hypothetical protein n=1 Tax=Gottfriedia sp. NPDC056225 TaxID=3345751 RepID=UPI0035D9BD28
MKNSEKVEKLRQLLPKKGKVKFEELNYISVGDVDNYYEKLKRKVSNQLMVMNTQKGINIDKNINLLTSRQLMVRSC